MAPDLDMNGSNVLQRLEASALAEVLIWNIPIYTVAAAAV